MSFVFIDPLLTVLLERLALARVLPGRSAAVRERYFGALAGVPFGRVAVIAWHSR